MPARQEQQQPTFTWVISSRTAWRHTVRGSIRATDWSCPWPAVRTLLAARGTLATSEPLVVIPQLGSQIRGCRHRDRDPARLILGHAVGAISPLRVFAEMDVGEVHAIGVHDAECLVEFNDGPRRREAA